MSLYVEKNLALSTGFNPSLQMVRRQISSAEVLTLFSTPITLLPAKLATVYLPHYALFSKPAGVAYNIGGVTGINISCNGLIIGGNIAAGLLDQSAATYMLSLGPGNASSLFSQIFLGVRTNSPLTISCSGANPSAGDSPLNVLIYYIECPLSLGF